MQVVDAVERDGFGQGGGQADLRRSRAHARAHRHSAQVRTLRRVLPLVAGGAVIALGAWLFNPFAAVLPGVSVGPVTLSGTKVRMENPKLSGFRKGDRGYEVTATAALQDMRKPSLIELEAMRGHVATDEKGGLAWIEAATGLFDTTREALDLKQDIRIWTDKGEEAQLQSAAVDFKAGSVKSSETVTVSVPSGQVVADGLDVVENGRVISFIGNVHTVFHQDKAKDSKADGKVDGKAEPKVPLRVLTSSAEPTDGRP
ncbi:lipopolysaccharide-assembly, LptC-related protein [Methylobacterium sp. WL8]|uniref:LPS export ABC transporter periplasmic protein LptC n=1 Tax=Methylobacterium sp. WL8 TaxID=2603899 RepID=UPI0011C9CAC2|nr:lipopolysaccharide-assembly, LptC-related protein [Methylobacterium sp. WL8]TXN79685.1 lipopolysaccharide-assembly, LptC-related protein [Methylobacterium sp. WL8]